MKIRSIFYHLKQGFKNIYRNRLFSLASIATITACVFLFGVFYSIMMNFEYMVKKAENEVCVTVFFDEGLSDTEIKKLGDTISNSERSVKCGKAGWICGNCSDYNSARSFHLPDYQYDCHWYYSP